MKGFGSVSKGIIAILRGSAEAGRQSLTADGPVLFECENGSSVQINNCHDPAAPAVKINVAGGVSPIDKTALLVTGPASTKPLVEFATREPLTHAPREQVLAAFATGC